MSQCSSFKFKYNNQLQTITQRTLPNTQPHDHNQLMTIQPHDNQTPKPRIANNNSIQFNSISKATHSPRSPIRTSQQPQSHQTNKTWSRVTTKTKLAKNEHEKPTRKQRLKHIRLARMTTTSTRKRKTNEHDSRIEIEKIKNTTHMARAASAVLQHQLDSPYPPTWLRPLRLSPTWLRPLRLYRLDPPLCLFLLYYLITLCIHLSTAPRLHSLRHPTGRLRPFRRYANTAWPCPISSPVRSHSVPHVNQGRASRPEVDERAARFIDDARHQRSGAAHLFSCTPVPTGLQD